MKNALGSFGGFLNVYFSGDIFEVFCKFNLHLTFKFVGTYGIKYSLVKYLILFRLVSLFFSRCFFGFISEFAQAVLVDLFQLYC